MPSLKSVLRIGRPGLETIARKMLRAPLTLDFNPLVEEVAAELNCDASVVGDIIIEVLIPLNGVRRSSGMSAEGFCQQLDAAVGGIESPDWSDPDTEKWQSLAPALRPFFEPDNFFSQA